MRVDRSIRVLLALGIVLAFVLVLAAVLFLTEKLFVVFAHLRELGVWDESLVILAADHGEELFEHGGWDHGPTLYQHQLWVPLILRPPGGLSGGGRRHPGVVRLIDLMPTLLAQIGIPAPPELDGEDLSPVLA